VYISSHIPFHSMPCHLGFHINKMIVFIYKKKFGAKNLFCLITGADLTHISKKFKGYFHYDEG
jgi:hypothetical protein